MRYKTKGEKQDMTLDQLIAYREMLDAHSLKWDKIILFVMGFCLGGGLCTVLMYSVHVGF